MNEDTHILLKVTIPVYKVDTHNDRQLDQSSYFCRGPDDFCWGPAPVGPTLVTGLSPCVVMSDSQCVTARRTDVRAKLQYDVHLCTAQRPTTLIFAIESNSAIQAG